VRIETRFINQLLNQIQKSRFYDGSYTYVDPLLLVRHKLECLRDGRECNPLNDYDARLLLRAIRTNRDHVIEHDRSEAIEKLLDKMYQICVHGEWAHPGGIVGDPRAEGAG